MPKFIEVYLPKHKCNATLNIDYIVSVLPILDSKNPEEKTLIVMIPDINDVTTNELYPDITDGLSLL